MHDPLVIAYLAGTIDSDGCITVHKSDYAKRVLHTTLVTMYTVRVSISQVERPAVQLALDTFGGNIYIARRGSGRRDLFVWRINNRAAADALVELLPFLRLKGAQAKNAMLLQSLMKQPRWPTVAIEKGEPLVRGTDFAELVGAKQKTVLEACRLQSIPSVKVGKYRMVPVSFVAEWRRRRVVGIHQKRSPEISAAMEACFQEAKRLNLVGERAKQRDRLALAGCGR